jgi:hypothetical protein
MHHARHRQIHAVGAAIVERVRDAMREESAGSGTKQVFFRPRRLDNRECLGMASLEDADSVSDRVLAGKSWPHWLSGDTQLSTKEVSSIRGRTKHRQQAYR